MTVVAAPLSQAVGYVVIVGIGFVIAFVMLFVTRLLKKTTGEDNSKTEMFLAANRSIGTGLTASAVVSGWLWSTAMLASALVTYDYGIAGSFWFASGCSPMIVFFALLGVAVKLRIPEAHTLLEIVRIRYGKAGHLVWIGLCLVNNIIAVANMLLGASAAISALTGINEIAATYLLPIGVIVYTFVGGIKATFLTDYFHTFTILIIACWFTSQCFAVSEVQSIGHLYELVVAAGKAYPVDGNEDGSYVTMTSHGALMFGIIHILANFGLVIMDTGFFLKALSAHNPRTVVVGYTVGGIAYYAVPFALGGIAGMLALGLEDSPIWPTYPDRMTTEQVDDGLVLPYAAIAIGGKGGAAAVLLIVFMAVTSTLSAQVISVSSIISCDIYRQYFNRSASDSDMIRWTHIGIVFFALFAASFSTALYYGDVNLDWTLYFLGVLTCPGIFPTVFTILWKKQSKAAAIISPLLGMATGLATWLGTAQAFYGEISVTSTGGTMPCVYGTVASAFSPALYSVVITLIKPANFDWRDYRKEKLAFDSAEDVSTTHSHIIEEDQSSYEANKALFKKYGKIAAFWSAATFLGHWVLWPLPMYASKYVFSKEFFEAWYTIAIIWLWCTLLIAGFYPLIDGRGQLLDIWRAVRGKEAKAPSTSSSEDVAQKERGLSVEKGTSDVSSPTPSL